MKLQQDLYWQTQLISKFIFQAYAPELYLLEATPEVRQAIAASSEGSTRPETRTSYDFEYARQSKALLSLVFFFCKVFQKFIAVFFFDFLSCHLSSPKSRNKSIWLFYRILFFIILKEKSLKCIYYI